MPSKTTMGIPLENHRLKALSWGRTIDEDASKMPFSIPSFSLFIYFVPEIFGAISQSMFTSLIELRAIPIVPNMSIVCESIIARKDVRPTRFNVGAGFNWNLYES
jgi:hypothetical protein